VTILDSKAHSCAYSTDGQTLFVRMGSGIAGQEERKEGAFITISEEDLTLLYESRDSPAVIADIKFSPNGEKICMGREATISLRRCFVLGGVCDAPGETSSDVKRENSAY
jgi:hypothetical protein